MNDLKYCLNKLLLKKSTKKCIQSDPIEFPHRYQNLKKMDQQIQSPFIFKPMETPLKNSLELISDKIERQQVA